MTEIFFSQREAEELCDNAHYLLREYKHQIGLAARKCKQIALNQIEHDLDIVDADAFIDKCIEISKRTLDGVITPYASGHRMDDNGSACYAWAVFFIKDLPNDIDLDSDFLAEDLTGWARMYSGPGRAFCQDPYAKKGRTRILVRQFRGLDI